MQPIGCKGGIFMKTTKQLKKITLCALFAAISVVIGTVCKLYLTFGAVRLTFENLTVLLSGIFFGPIYGAAVGTASDLITCFTAAQPSVNPLITLGACSVGLVGGIMSKVLGEKKYKLTGILLCVFPAHIVGNMIIKTAALIIFYSYPIPLALLRIPTYILIGTCESLLIYTIISQKYIKRQMSQLS